MQETPSLEAILMAMIRKGVADGLAKHAASENDKQPPSVERSPREIYGSDPNIGKVLLLSTGQALLPTPNFKPCRSEETGYGWVVWPLDQEANMDFEDWFGEINMWAYQNGYHMIEFDRDNAPHPKFRCFENPTAEVAEKPEPLTASGEVTASKEYLDSIDGEPMVIGPGVGVRPAFKAAEGRATAEVDYVGFEVEGTKVAKKSPADFNKKAAEFGIKYSPGLALGSCRSAGQVNVMAATASHYAAARMSPFNADAWEAAAPPLPPPRLNKDITKADGFSAIEEYFKSRAPQLLWNGYKLLTIIKTADGGLAVWSGYGKTYFTPYLYLEDRVKGRYKSLCQAFRAPILTIDDCGLGSYLTRHEIAHIEVTLPPEYRLIEEYYAGKVAKRTGLPYMQHIDDGLWILRVLSKVRSYELAEDQRQWPAISVEALYEQRFTELTRVFCVHPIYQDRNKEWMQKHRDVCGAVDVESCREYANAANSYLPKLVDRSVCRKYPRGSALWALLAADKLQNYADFNANADKFSPEKTAQLKTYFTNWLDALRLTTQDHELIKQYYDTI